MSDSAGLYLSYKKVQRLIYGKRDVNYDFLVSNITRAEKEAVDFGRPLLLMLREKCLSAKVGTIAVAQRVTLTKNLLPDCSGVGIVILTSVRANHCHGVTTFPRNLSDPGKRADPVVSEFRFRRDRPDCVERQQQCASVQLHFELTDLLVEFTLQFRFGSLMLLASVRERVLQMLQRLLLPQRHLGRMHPLMRRDLVDRAFTDFPITAAIATMLLSQHSN